MTASFRNLPENASHDAATRCLDWTPGPGQIGDFAANVIRSTFNVLAALNATTDQTSAPTLGATSPWQEGAKVRLTAPDLSTAIDSITAHAGSTGAAGQYVPQTLRFTLSTVPERTLPGGATPIGLASAAPLIYRPVFTSSASGWSLTAHTDANQNPQGFAPEALQRQGTRLYIQSGVNAGLPWVPESYTLTGPDGTRYQLDAQGQLTSVQFADGVQWLVSDAGIALVEQGNALATNQRIDFARDAQGRLVRVSTKSAESVAQNAALVESAIAYKYDKGPFGSDDATGRLVLSRTINSTGTGTPYGYDNAGKVLPDAITANLGAATSWISAPTANVWTGSLQAGQTTSIAFAVRESELASTIKTPGALGAVIIALQTELTDPLATVEVTGATVLGTTTVNGKRTTLLRVTEAGLKLVRLTGTGHASIRISIAGDTNQDGKVDGADGQALNSVIGQTVTAGAGSASYADVNGDGQVTLADRQVLYANYGFKANQAPVQINTAVLNTHTDLAANASLSNVAQDLEGDSIFWRILSATHGTAKLAADGQTLLFTPEMGYAGQASIAVQADDGFAAAAPIALTVNVSGVKLISIHLSRIASLATGANQQMQLTGDFEDQDGVALVGSYAQFTSSNSNVLTVSSTGRVKGIVNGQTIVKVQARGIEGVNVFTVSSDPGVYQYGPQLDENGFEVDVYPRAITLALQAQRQLKVSLPDRTNISAAAAGTQYFISDSSIADITPDGLIHAKANGHATLSIINGGMQHDIVLYVQQPDIGTATVKWASGAAVQDVRGNLLMIAPGSLPTGTQASIRSHDMANLGIPLPAPGILTALAAIDIDVGNADSKLPLQLAIKVTPPIDPLTGLPETLVPGTQVQFWRKGTIVDTDGSTHDTWWLVDNGVIGDDGMARTSSLPFTGVKGSSLMLLTKSFVVNNAIAQILSATSTAWDAMWSSGDNIAMATGQYISSVATDIFGGIGTLVSALMYTPEGSFKTAVPKSAFDRSVSTSVFPPTPLIPINTPYITSLEFTPETRKLVVGGHNFIPQGQSANSFDLQVWLIPRSEQILTRGEPGVAPINGQIWQGFTPTLLPDGTLQIGVPDGVALSLHYVYLSRSAKGAGLIPANGTELPVGSELVPGWKAAQEQTLVTTAHSINVFGITEALTNKLSLLGQVTKDELGADLTLAGRYTDQIAFSDDGSVAYIAGAGNNIYVYDVRTQRIVKTVKIDGAPAGISSLAVASNWLYVTEGSAYSASGGRLMRINIDPQSPRFLQELQSIKLDVNAPFGFADMAVNNGGYLALTAPTTRSTVTNGGVSAGGNVVVLNLHQIDENGKLLAGGSMTLDATNFPVLGHGKVPQYISSGQNNGEFLLSSGKDYGAGLTGFVVNVDEGGKLSGTAKGQAAKLTPAASDRSWLQRKFQQNIQRAAGNVVVEYAGKQYALVSDYNFLFNDSHFVDYENYGFGKEIGGKIGIVQDPFGTSGGPVYLGATSPIQGGAVDHLTLGPDGMLYADVFMDEVSDAGEQMFKSLFVWNAAELVKDALAAQERGQSLSVPIDRMSAQAGQIPAARATRYDGANATQEFGWTYGIGSYRQPGVPVNLSNLNLRKDIIKLTQIRDETQPLQTLEEKLSPGDSNVAKIVTQFLGNIITLGYFERYNKRVSDYNAGKYVGKGGYDAFVQANLIDALATGGAVVASGGVAAELAPLAALARTEMGALAGTMTSGAYSLMTFDALVQAGQVAISDITRGASGQTTISTSQILVSGLFGALLTPVLGKLGENIGQDFTRLFPTATTQIEYLFAKLGEITGRDASRAKLLGTQAEVVGKTEIRVLNTLASVTPKSDSMTIAKASDWFRADVAKIMKSVEGIEGLEAQVVQAFELRKKMADGAMAALYDQNGARKAFKVSFGQQSLEKIYAKVESSSAQKLEGDELHKAVLKEITTLPEERFAFEAKATCFAKGTLVHTKQGLVPIEKLKVGDWVLSKPEDGTGEVAYKRVTQTFAHGPTEVFNLNYMYPEQNGLGRFSELTTTSNHPFWIVGEGWTTASELNTWPGEESRLLLVDGREMVSVKRRSIFQTSTPSIGWMSSVGDITDVLGAEWDFENECVHRANVYAEDSIQDPEDRMPSPLLRIPVYNIEVEDFHTYFVGKEGVWVHNKNLSTAIKVQNGGPALPEDTPVFYFNAEVAKFIRDNPNGPKWGVIPSKSNQNPSYYTARGEKVPLSLEFEEGVQGRLIGPDGTRWEYAVFYENANPAGLPFISVEGRYFNSQNMEVFIDRKWESFIKAGRYDEALDLLWRITQRLEQSNAPRVVVDTTRWSFEMNAGVKGQDLVGLRKAKEFVDSIRNDDGKYTFKVIDDVTKAEIVDPNNASKMARLRAILDKIELRNDKVPTEFPQRVLIEGTDTVATLTADNIAALLPQARQYWLVAGASASLLRSASFHIDDLPIGLAGQTQGTSITLDASGAGWGWFVDSTPMDQAEFDPGASATSFTSGASSPATGKLDLLTVLIHELGHVVGLPSTATANDVMSQYLAPGQRRLPDAVDIAALQAEGSPYYSHGTSVTLVAPPAGYAGSLSYTQLHPAAAVINPTLANGNFAAGLGPWVSAGKVEPSAAIPSTVTLGESTTAQAHLAQAFVLSAQDRFLTFTVSGLDLQTNSIEQNGVFTAAPQDAFEVALQNANTGANLLATGSGTGNSNLGTSRSDALLNVQLASSSAAATLQERAVSGLRHTDNADGSRTYVLDLSGIAAGTAVNLSFDLIGFGLTSSQLGSKVNISDVRLISTPVAVNDAATLAEDGSATITVQANDLNAEAAGFAPRLAASAQHGQVSVNAAGSFVYTPDANFFGADSFTYQYSNAAGTELSNTATVTLTVTPVNDAPVAADVTVSTTEDTVVTIHLVATDVDSAGAELQFAIQTQPGHGSVVKNADGSYSYTPAKDYNGADSFTYTVSDGSLTSNVATVRISITAVNDAPTLGNQALTVAEDTALNGNLLATASDVDSPVLTAAIVAGPQHGTLTVNANGTFSYQGSKDYFGADSFTYRVSDDASDGELDSEVATVSFTVTAVNDAPVAFDVAITVAEDNAVAITLIALDVDSALATLQFSIQTQPTHGSLVQNADGSYSYTPAANYNGTDSFTYTVTDGDLVSNAATVRINVTAVNDAPTLPSRSVSVDEDSNVTFDPLSGAVDIDGDSLTAQVVAGPQHGSLTVNADGTFSYQGNKDYFGADSISYFLKRQPQAMRKRHAAA